MRSLKPTAGFLIGLCLGLICLPAFALEHLEGEKAKAYIGNIKTKLTSENYTYEVLKRSHRDTMNGRFSDAVLFSKATDRFYYKKRSDSNHVILVGHPDGRQEDPVTAEPMIWNPLRNTLGDDHPYPHVFLDDEGNELLILYLGRKTRIKYKMNDDGYLELSIRVSSPGRRGGGRRT